MPGPRLSDGSPAWFVRIRAPLRYQLKPCAPQGWALMIGFVLAEVLGAAAIIGPHGVHRDPPPMVWAAWLVFFVAALAVFLVVAFRKSVPADNGSDRGVHKMMMAFHSTRARLLVLGTLSLLALGAGIGVLMS